MNGIKADKKVRKSAKRQSQYDNFRTILSANYAEIMETLGLLEEFLNNLKH